MPACGGRPPCLPIRTSTRRVARGGFAGFSAGAGLAVTIALTGRPFEVRGAIAVGPSGRDAEDRREAMGEAAARGTRLWLLIGENDSVRDQTERLCEELHEAGVEYHLDVVPHLGHAFPEDFDRRLLEALDFVLEA
jgi:acetyl esterase/lipase